jgi:hypothetical protein
MTILMEVAVHDNEEELVSFQSTELEVKVIEKH